MPTNLTFLHRGSESRYSIPTDGRTRGQVADAVYAAAVDAYGPQRSPKAAMRRCVELADRLLAGDVVQVSL